MTSREPTAAYVISIQPLVVDLKESHHRIPDAVEILVHTGPPKLILHVSCCVVTVPFTNHKTSKQATLISLRSRVNPGRGPAGESAGSISALSKLPRPRCNPDIPLSALHCTNYCRLCTQDFPFLSAVVVRVPTVLNTEEKLPILGMHTLIPSIRGTH